MLVRVYATKPDGYYWKAPSWSDGRKFELGQFVELDLDDADMSKLVEDVRGGYHLRYERVEVKAPEVKAPEAKKK